MPGTDQKVTISGFDVSHVPTIGGAEFTELNFAAKGDLGSLAGARLFNIGGGTLLIVDGQGQYYELDGVKLMELIHRSNTMSEATRQQAYSLAPVS